MAEVDWHAAAAALPRKPPVPKCRKIRKKKKAAQRRAPALTLDLSRVARAEPSSALRTARGAVRRPTSSILILPKGTSAWRARAVFSLLRRELGGARVAQHPVELLPAHRPLERDLVVRGAGGLPCPEALQTLLSLPEQDWETGVRAVLVRHFDATPRVPAARPGTPPPRAAGAGRTPRAARTPPAAGDRSPSDPPSPPASA